MLCNIQEIFEKLEDNLKTIKNAREEYNISSNVLPVPFTRSYPFCCISRQWNSLGIYIDTHTLGNERITFSSARACEVTKADFGREARIEKLDFFLISAIAQTIAAARDNYSIRSAIVADGRISMRGWNRFALKSHDAICEYGARHSRYSIHGASRVYCARRRRLSREVSQIHRLHLQPCKKVGKKDRVRSPRHLNLPNCFGAPYEVTYARINRWQLGNHTNITASLFPREICIYRPKTAFN